MDSKRLFLILVAGLLAVLVVLDNSDIDLPGLLSGPDGWRLPGASPAPSIAIEDKMRALQRAVTAREGIEQAYRETAPRYATKAAELDTLTFDAKDPRQVSLKVINQRLRRIRHLEVQKITAGEPRSQGEGVALVSVSLGLESPTHEAIMQALVSLTRPGQGYTWEGFDLQADAEAKRVRLSGEVLTIVVEAAE